MLTRRGSEDFHEVLVNALGYHTYHTPLKIDFTGGLSSVILRGGKNSLLEERS